MPLKIETNIKELPNSTSFPMVYEFVPNREFKVLFFEKNSGVVVQSSLNQPLYPLGRLGINYDDCTCPSRWTPRPDITVTFE